MSLSIRNARANTYPAVYLNNDIRIYILKSSFIWQQRKNADTDEKSYILSSLNH